MAILQLVEAGKLSLDTKVHEVVDDWLGEPLAALIPANNSMIEQVTVEQLLAHTSGLPDYEDENIRAWTLASPKRNFTPLDYIRYGMANGGNFHFAPGSGDIAIYSGIGYILAGFVLAAVQDAPTWADLDQSFIFDRLPAAEAAAMRAQTNFVMTGVCDALFGDRLVGQYIVQVKQSHSHIHPPLEGLQPAVRLTRPAGRRIFSMRATAGRTSPWSPRGCTVASPTRLAAMGTRWGTWLPPRRGQPPSGPA